jgi:hypothetical protein
MTSGNTTRPRTELNRAVVGQFERMSIPGHHVYSLGVLVAVANSTEGRRYSVAMV